MATTSHDVEDVLDALVASEIPFELHTLTTGRYLVRLGDPCNGFVDQQWCRSAREVATWLADAAAKHFPSSHFASHSLIHAE